MRGDFLQMFLHLRLAFLAFEVWFDRIILLLIALNSIGSGRSTVDMDSMRGASGA